VPAAIAEEEGSLIERILRSDERLAPIVAKAEDYRLQVLLGLVEDGPDGRPKLRQIGFRADAQYFYPASAVKLFAAVQVFRTLAEIRESTGLPIDESTPLVYHPLFEDETLEDADPSNVGNGKITVAHEIRKLFLVSDNVAFNRLYELIGPAELNRALIGAGLGSSRIVHRLDEFRSAEDHLRLPRIDLVGDGFRHSLPARTSRPELPPQPPGDLLLGRAHWSDGGIVEGPKDFDEKNRFFLADLQRGLCMTLRGDADCGGRGFQLTEPQRELLREVMGQLPRESANPVYDPEAYPDHWVKFLLPGLRRVVSPERLRVYGKTGRAYGFSVENSYVVDLETGRSFFLAVTLYTNKNGIVGDDEYEYETIADSFLADLGEVVARTLWDGAG
jgi:hypothetical protein